MNESWLTLNQTRTNNVVHGNQVCGCACDDVCGFNGQPCQASSKVYKGINQMWEAIVCPKNN